MTQGLQIGTVAKATGLTVDAIRFYEKSGLLQRPLRSAGGFRLFRQQDLEDLRFVRKAQELGFSLDEVRELLFLQSERAGACEQVQEMLTGKLDRIREKLAELRKLEADLSAALHQCQREIRRAGGSTGEGCPVLGEIGGTRSGR